MPSESYEPSFCCLWKLELEFSEMFKVYCGVSVKNPFCASPSLSSGLTNRPPVSGVGF